jgi:hypothetical protein
VLVIVEPPLEVQLSYLVEMVLRGAQLISGLPIVKLEVAVS